MDEARRIAYNIAKLPAFLADLDPHQRTIRAPCKRSRASRSCASGGRAWTQNDGTTTAV